MNCHSCTEALSALIDRELPEERQTDVFVHLADCPSCRHFFTSLMELRADLSAAPPPRIPRTLDARVERAAAARFAPRTSMWEHLRSFWMQRLVVPAPAFAAALAVVLLSLILTYATLRQTPPATPAHQAQVTYIMSLPPVEVQSVPLPSPDRIQ